MNKIYYILALGIAFFASCDSQLDLAPEDKIVEDKVFEKVSTAESAVASTYRLLVEANAKDYVMSEATTPICKYNANVGRTMDPINNGSVLPDDGNIERIYEYYYKAANQANLLIYKINELGKYDEDMEKEHIAEAKFMRAYAFHRLLGWYGDGALMNQPDKDGIVLYLEHYDEYDPEKDIRPRNNNEACYTQMIKDLTEAIVDLAEPSEVESVERRISRANKATCEALLSRLYLWKHDYENAALYAQKVLSRPEYDIEPDVHKIFPPNPDQGPKEFSIEHIFGFPVSTNGGNYQYGGNGIYYAYSNYQFSDDFFNSFVDTDIRKVKLVKDSDGNVTLKYPNRQMRDNVTIMRLAEVILTRAEALTHTEASVTKEMVDLLNRVYLRANPTATPHKVGDFTDVAQLRAAIIEERTKELAWEGTMRFDHLRTDRNLYNPELPENKKVLPIPLREVSISDGVVEQNEGYR